MLRLMTAPSLLALEPYNQSDNARPFTTLWLTGRWAGRRRRPRVLAICSSRRRHSGDWASCSLPFPTAWRPGVLFGFAVTWVDDGAGRVLIVRYLIADKAVGFVLDQLADILSVSCAQVRIIPHQPAGQPSIGGPEGSLPIVTPPSGQVCHVPIGERPDELCTLGLGAMEVHTGNARVVQAGFQRYGQAKRFGRRWANVGFVYAAEVQVIGGLLR